MSVPFSAASTPARLTESEWELTATPDWSQGRTLFGGLVAAAVTHAMSNAVADELALRTLSVMFAAPIETGSAQIATSHDRTGSSTAFTSATISQDGSLRTRAQAVFAKSRESSIVVAPQPGELELSLADAPAVPYLEGVVPTFMKNFDVRWGLGDAPFSGSARGTLGGYCRHREPLTGTKALLGLLDVWPPAVLPMANGPAAGSTVSWTAHILRQPPTDPTAWYEFRYDTVAAEQGYATYVGTLSCEGAVIAWTEQLAAIFA